MQFRTKITVSNVTIEIDFATELHAQIKLVIDFDIEFDFGIDFLFEFSINR